jgi:hypothetical protein
MWSFEPAGVELRTWEAFEARPVLVAHHFLAPSGSSLSGRLAETLKRRPEEVSGCAPGWRLGGAAERPLINLEMCHT